MLSFSSKTRRVTKGNPLHCRLEVFSGVRLEFFAGTYIPDRPLAVEKYLLRESDQGEPFDFGFGQFGDANESAEHLAGGIKDPPYAPAMDVIAGAHQNGEIGLSGLKEQEHFYDVAQYLLAVSLLNLDHDRVAGTGYAK